jgi:Glycosyl transferase family 2
VTAPATGGERSSVSVIVPCYNYGHLLSACVASVLGQSGVDVRLLVIDDCSCDGSADVAARLAELDERIEFRRHQQNMGLIATANEGLRWASGDYVVLLSADDLLLPGSLQRATTVMTEYPNVGLTYGRALRMTGESPPAVGATRQRSPKIWAGADWIGLRCRSAHNCIASPEAVVRTSVQRAVGGYDPGCRHTSDLNMWLRIASVADVAFLRGASQAVYRVHAGSMWRSHDSPIVDLRERRAAFDSFFGECSSRLEWPSRLREAAARTLARQALWKASRTVDRGEEGELTDELAQFALEVYPQARRLHEWRGLKLRQRIGAGRSLLFPPFLLTGAARRLRHHASWMRLRHTGI